MFKIELRKTL